MQHAKKKEKTKGKSHIVIELIILLLIIGTIAFFAIPKLTDMLNTSRQNSADNDAQVVMIAAEAWLIEQKTAGLMPTIEADNLLSDGDVKQVLAIAGSIDDVTAQTVKVTVVGNTEPDCYTVKSVTLTKKGAIADISAA